ncbi:MAG: hypothetical protein ACW98K_04805 [Candidatus Kariarchaeaceae archaeon]
MKNYDTSYSLGYSDGKQQLQITHHQYIHQITATEEGYFLLSSNFALSGNNSGSKYALEFISMEKSNNWLFELYYNQSEPSILSVSQRWVVLDILSLSDFFQGIDQEYDRSFMLYDRQAKTIQKIVIPGITPLLENQPGASNKTVYTSATRYTGQIIENVLVVVEYGKLMRVPVKVFRYDLMNQVLIDSYVVDSIDDGRKGAKILEISDLGLTLSVNTILSTFPAVYRIDIHQIEFGKDETTRTTLGEVSCDISCVVYSLTPSELMIIEEEDYGFPDIFTRLTFGNLENQSRYVWDPKYRDPNLSVKLIRDDLVLLHGNRALPSFRQYPFVGFLEIINTDYNITEIQLQFPTTNSSYLQSLDVNDNHQIVIAISTTNISADGINITSHVIVLDPNQKPENPFFIEFPYIPNMITTVFVTVIYVVFVNRNRRRQERMTAILYPERE